MNKENAVSTQREVPRALEELNQVVSRYDELVGRLSTKLETVITPAPPIASDNKEQSDYGTKLSAEINLTRCRLRDITDGLESLIQRIEL